MKQFMLPLVADPKDLVASITMTRAGDWSRTDKHKVFNTFIRVQVLRSLFDMMTSAHGHEPAVRATLTALHGNQPSDKLLLDKFAQVVSEAVKSLTALRTAAMECDTVVQQTPLLKADHSALQIAIDIAAECPTERQANREKISSLRSSARMGPTRYMPDYVGALSRAPPLLGQAAIAAAAAQLGSLLEAGHCESREQNSAGLASSSSSSSGSAAGLARHWVQAHQAAARGAWAGDVMPPSAKRPRPLTAGSGSLSPGAAAAAADPPADRAAEPGTASDDFQASVTAAKHLQRSRVLDHAEFIQVNLLLARLRGSVLAEALLSAARAALEHARHGVAKGDSPLSISEQLRDYVDAIRKSM